MAATYDAGLNTFTLGTDDEGFVIPATIPGGTTPLPANANVIGNGRSNDLTGDATNNRLDGGAGNDILRGGRGDDTYLVSETADIVAELGGEGYDTVFATADYTLSANIEKLVFTGIGDLRGYGNELANFILGNEGDNFLVGGSGNDTIDGGGTGNDILLGGSGIDTISFESSFQGVTVNLETSFVSDGSIVSAFENIIGSSFGDSLAGDGSDNTIQGSGGHDQLAGGSGNDWLDGGVGDDAMFGGLGNDTYIVDSHLDVITEEAGQGIDTVIAQVTYDASLTAVDILKAATGTTAIDLTGNTGNNTIYGNEGINRLSAGSGNDKLYGGYGNDELSGGTGKDIYVFNSRLNKSGNVDKILDYRSADDTIHLDNAIFRKLTKTGVLSSAFFYKVGSRKMDSNDYIVYNQTTGVLSYDADANGKGAAVAFAKLNGAALVYKDFIVV